MMKKPRVMVAFTLASLLVFAGCSSSGDDGDSAGAPLDDSSLGTEEIQTQMAGLYQEAVDSGNTSVVLYGPGQGPYEPVYQQFMDRYPDIKVTGDYIFGAELNTRLDQEFTSEKHVGGLQIGAAPVTYATYSADRFEPYEPFTYPDSERPDPTEVGPDGSYRALLGYIYGMAYNTDKVDEADAPTGISAFTDSKWKGEISIDNPTTVSGITNAFTQLRGAGLIDEEWVSEMAANDPEITAKTPLTVQAAATGEVSIVGLQSYLYVLPLQEQGLPLEYVFMMDEGPMIQQFYLGLYKNAPSEAASKLFFNWAFSNEGQEAFAGVGIYGLRDDAPAPPGMPNLADVRDELIDAVPDEDWADETQETIRINRQFFE